MDRQYAKEIPIVAMTANAFAEDVLKCKNIMGPMSRPLTIKRS